ncbi:MAG: Rieske 2Fe-2S domain-containing protein [Magnetococcales bacterium]|nr:Rieske 2Fe-2S domain-containing protein [Magnetococcales bacterium]NGZ29287.1 Rieske 2Fe-2S domain-containing protein [Magnetococcales bacterium]
MSKALNYLAAVRPEAATHLLEFYKHSTKALDDKTRHLIQIVTKVVTGTERGLRQYAPKALKAGASREEILDAVLMAFPAAGLPKVLDALTILQEMDLVPAVPETAPAPSPPHAQPIASLDTIPLHKLTCAEHPAGKVVIYRLNEKEVKVYKSQCPHAKASLCKGIDHGDQVECKIHNWRFDLASGKCLQPDGKSGLEVVKTVVKDGKIWLQ